MSQTGEKGELKGLSPGRQRAQKRQLKRLRVPAQETKEKSTKQPRALGEKRAKVAEEKKPLTTGSVRAGSFEQGEAKTMAGGRQRAQKAQLGQLRALAPGVGLERQQKQAKRLKAAQAEPLSAKMTKQGKTYKQYVGS